ncbi:hypothetical protein L1887_15112 [Cichorium endivia]|nr:hypothetical protein L1887_15112 [Cichorium endivia]
MVGRTPRMEGIQQGVLSESNKKVIGDGVEIRLTGGGFCRRRWWVGHHEWRGYSRGVLSESNKKVIGDGEEIHLTGGGLWCVGVVGYRSFVGNGARPEETGGMLSGPRLLF